MQLHDVGMVHILKHGYLIHLLDLLVFLIQNCSSSFDLLLIYNFHGVRFVVLLDAVDYAKLALADFFNYLVATC